MGNFVRFGKRGGAHDFADGRGRRGRRLIAGVAMALWAAHPALAEAKPRADPKTKALLGCWQASDEMSCWDNRIAPSGGNLCFSRHGKVYALGYNGGEGERLGDTYGFQMKRDKITFISTLRNRDSIAKVVYPCRMVTISSTQIDFACSPKPNFFDGTWTKLCSRTNADGTSCADKKEILPRKGWEAAVEYLPKAWFLP